MIRAALVVFACILPNVLAADENPIRVLFLGDNGPHRPAERFRQLEPVLAKRGIELTYTDKLDDLNPQTLGEYDGLMIYANIERIEPEQEQALLDYVAGGKGLIPIHCASFCFHNSPKYIELVGAQFQRHGTGVFRTSLANPAHPIVDGFESFESWDETYVHHRHNDGDRTILEFRTEGDHKEPWTWVREHGKGRVFYTAWGHDDRTWGHAGFQNLIERGIRWAVGRDPGIVPDFSDRPEMTPPRSDVKPLEYAEAEIPFYPAGERWGTVGEPITKMQLPLPAEESLKHFVTPVGFEVQLFAAEPEIGKPICMAWDERGRLWIAETVDYPNELRPEGEGRDRIRICEDTDGDGRADNFTVFAERLSIPTSLTFAYGGVVVLQAPDTLFLKDTDGDDVADERRVLFTGWSTQDTHAGPSNLQYGPDNWFYGIVGYSGFRGEVAGERHSFRQGFFRFKLESSPAARSSRAAGPEVTKLEFLRNTNNNSWGVGFSEEGILFGSTANGNPSEYMPIANRYYENVRGGSSSVLDGIALDNEYDPITDNLRQVDHHGGFTSAAGHALYTARTYPREYWNRTAFVSDPTGHLTATFVLQPNGSGFRSRNAWNLLASDDEWSAPIMAEVGPDGHVWVIDWYNYIVQHNPTPTGYETGKGNAYETELRDKKHGRIYRIVHKEGESSPAMPLRDASSDRLVAALRSNNLLWRRHAQRLLVEHGELDVLPVLVSLAGDPEVDAIGLNTTVIHALWTMRGLGALDGSHPEALATVIDALDHGSAGVRRTAVLVLPRNDEGLRALLASEAFNDSDDQVKLAALLALAEMPPSEEAANAVAAVLQDQFNVRDRWLLDAATSAAARHDVYFLRTVAVAGRRGVREEALGPIRIVAEHYARGNPGRAVAELLPALKEAPPAVAEAVVAGLARGWPQNAQLTLGPEAEKVLVELMPRLSAAGRSQLIALAARWGTTALEQYAAEISKTLLEQVRDTDANGRERLAAARQLIEFRKNDPEAAKAIVELITPRTSPQLAEGLLQALAQSEAEAVGPAIVEHLSSMTPSVRSQALSTLLARPEWTRAMMDGVEERTIQVADLSLDQKQALLAHPSRRIAERAKTLFSAGGGLPNPDRQKVLEELMPLTERSGDPVAGKVVFQKQCAKCHTHSGEGTKVGPDLTGMAVHPKHELLTQMIDPSRSVEGNYRAYTLVTTEGRVFTGLLASETRTSVELFDSEGKRHVILRDDIEELVASSKSLMPEGFEKQVSETELVDLLAFLAQRGRYLPLPLEKAATTITTRGMFFDEAGTGERLVFSDWSPKTFAGVPFQLVDPNGDRTPNAILLYGPYGNFAPRMPKSVSVPCNAPAKAIHLLSGISGWGHPLGEEGSVSMIVRLHYAGGETEDHELKNGVHFADYVRRIDVPGSEFAFNLRGRQLRYLSIEPRRSDVIERIEFVKGPDNTAPVVMAATLELPQ